MSTIVLPKNMSEDFYTFLDLAVDSMDNVFDDANINEEVIRGTLSFIEKNRDGFAIISLDSLCSLSQKVELLNALKEAGVDNWKGYDDAIGILESWENEPTVLEE